MLVGGLIGGLTGVGVARGMNRLAAADHPEVRWSAEFLTRWRARACCAIWPWPILDAAAASTCEGEAPSFWRTEVEQQLRTRRAFHALWNAALEMVVAEKLEPDLQAEFNRPQ